jgi:hypothetical protein
MRYMDEFFRVSADGRTTATLAETAEPTDTAVVEEVTNESTEQVTNEIDTITNEDSASEDPRSINEEVTNEAETVHPTVINQYPAYYPPGYAYPTVVLEDPNVKVETASVVSPEPTSSNGTKKMLMYLILAAVAFLVYKQLTKK